MTKSFIDKKASRTFKLVTRPAEEIEAARAEGREINPRIFVEVTKKKYSSDFPNSEDDEGFEDETFENPQPGEAMKYGILFDDRNYDYTKHLKTVGIVPGTVILDAPSTTFSNFKEESSEESESIDLEDPTIKETIEALNDTAFLQQNEFEDDFVDQLNEESSNSESDFISDEFDDLIREFEDEFSGSDCDDLEFSSCPEEIINPKDVDPSHDYDPVDHFNSILAQLKLKDDARIPDLSDFDSDEYFAELEKSDSDQDDIETCPRGSCQDVKPLLINEIQISKKTGRPIKPRPQENEDFELQEPKINFGIARPKGETIEEKKARKSQAKLLKLEKRKTKTSK
jgi:hypothetical protein